MKFNWKILVALVLMIGAVVWTVNSTRSTSYSGTSLNFEVGSGTVTMTNPSSESVPVQLAGTSTRSFTVSSTIQDVSGSSTRVGSGPKSTSLFEFELPPGVSEFTVARSAGVSFAADTNIILEATVQAANNGTKVKVLVGFLLAALFYMSYETEHRWLYRLLGKESSSKLHSKPYTGKPY